MADNALFAKGFNATLVLTIGGNPFETLDVEEWNYRRNVTTGQHDCAGQDRSYLDSITNFFDLNFRLLQRNYDLLRAIIQKKADLESGVVAEDDGLGMILKDRYGGSILFAARGLITDGEEVGAQGRTNAIGLTLPIRVRYLDPQ